MHDPHDALELAMGRLFRLRGVLDSSQAVPGLGVSASESMALGHLMTGETTQQELGSHLGLEKSTVSRLVDGMVHKGWVEKGRDPDNRRYQKLVLTPTGRAAAERITRAMRERHDRWIASLSPQERQALAVGLTALVRAMSEEFGLD